MAYVRTNGKSLEIREVDQANKLVATYVKTKTDEKSSRIIIIVPKNTNNWFMSILSAFLPAGYPKSVTEDYLRYQIYDSLQAFSSSIAGMLSSRAVLEGKPCEGSGVDMTYAYPGIGVGDSNASPTAALLLSVLQESMGRIATILFAHRLGTSLEPECKMYRLAADVFNDAAMILDCLSPAFPKAWRVALLSSSSVLRSMCGVAAGSSKASLSAHFATQGNLGELNAKDSSQETVISLMGMLVGSVVISHISSKWATWTALIFLLGIHLGTNYLAVKAVCMRNFNRQRANLFFSAIIDQMDDSIGGMPAEKLRTYISNNLTRLKFPSPNEISRQENVFERNNVLRWRGNHILGYCLLGVSFKTILRCLGPMNPATGCLTDTSAQRFQELLNIYQTSGYILWYDKPRKSFLVTLKSLSAQNEVEVQLNAWVQALYFAKFVPPDEPLIDALLRTRIFADLLCEGIFSASRLRDLGWDLSVSAMETHPGTRTIHVDADDI